jgi:N-acetylglutamate synthase-like GNAT family acetyltransferase
MLRRARKVEVAAIHALLWAAKDTIPLVEAFHTEPYRKWVEDRCTEKLVWVVVKRATIIGAMVMQGNEVFYLVVSPEHRRKGIAKILVEKAKAVCKEHGVTARVAPTNISATNLLTAEGFRCDGVIPGQPGSIMERWVGYSWNPASEHCSSQ